MELSKRMIMVFISMLVLIVAAPLLAQTNGNDPPVIYPSAVFESIAALSAAVVVITAFLKKQLGTNDTFTIVISAILSIGGCAIGYYFELGILVAVEWYYIFIYGITITLIANGLSTWEFIKTILTFFKLRIPEEKQ